MNAMQGELLLGLARASIHEALGGPAFAIPDKAWLQEPGASFVTLMCDGELRGCIGTVEAYRPLGEDVARNARATALKDFRFEPLTMAELDRVDIEVSLLSTPELLPFASEEELYGQLRFGVDGIILRFASRSATFLPQVWDQLPEPRDFMAQLRRKAGLDGLPLQHCLVQRYTVRKWCEDRRNGAPPERSLGSYDDE